MSCEAGKSLKNEYRIQQEMPTGRNLNPNDISIPPGYQIDVYAQDLDTPFSMAFDDNGDLLIADSGVATGNAKVIRLREGRFEILAENFNPPMTGINFHSGNIYVSHKGVISVISSNGDRQDIITGLPSFGDYSNNRVAFGPDNKMYFGQGTATNSGIVGLDNVWITEYPYFHDYPGSYIMLNGINYQTGNIFIPAEEFAYTGAFSPFGVPNHQRFEVIRGRVKASGSIMRCNPDGSDLELAAWGLRNPVQVNFDQNGRMFISNQGYDNRGSRPITNAPDELYVFEPDAWYGWPDYAQGEPITESRFLPEGGPRPELLLAQLPSIPPKPVAVFPPNSNVMGFDINYNERFGPVGDLYIAKFGIIDYPASREFLRSGAGHRVSKVNMITGQIETFAINKTGFAASSPYEGGFGRPTDVVFGPDGAMYISDMTATSGMNPNQILPNTGVIWRVTRTE